MPKDNETKTWPTLYKKASTGKIQEWTVSVEGSTLISAHGELGGKIQRDPDTITEGKNIGRKNETTPREQALKEAEAKHIKKLKKDYVTTIEAAEAGESSDLVEGGILPMLAHKYWEHPDKVTWPAAAQPKLDGHRCIAVVVGGKCTLWSRTRKPIASVPHIVAAVESLGFRDIILDGELFNARYHDDFEIITHLAKRDKPCPGGGPDVCNHAKKYKVTCPGYTEVQYHIYDADLPVCFADRHKAIDMQIRNWAEQRADDGHPVPLMPVETRVVADDAALMAAYEDFMEQNYEGAMVRNMASPYHHKKCCDLLKVKKYDDDEFEIVGVSAGRGKCPAVFDCRIPDDFENPKAKPGATFGAKMKGKLKDLQQYIDDPSLAIGRQMTVQYQGFTRKSMVPRFPVALRFREDL